MLFVALGLAVLGRMGLAVVSAGLYCSWYFCAARIRRASLLAKKMTSSSTTELELTFTSDVPFCSLGLSIKISPFGKCETASVKLIWIYIGTVPGPEVKPEVNPFLDFRNPNSFIWSFSKEIKFCKISKWNILEYSKSDLVQCNKI